MTLYGVNKKNVKKCASQKNDCSLLNESFTLVLSKNR